MITFKRLSIYLITFFIIAVPVIGFIDWKWLDKYLYIQANLTGNTGDIVHDDIVFVHLEPPKTGFIGEDLKLSRQSIIKLLNTIHQECINKRSPEGVVLDFYFSNDGTELFGLAMALQQLKDKNVPVYAAYHLDNTTTTFEDADKIHASDLYDNYLSGSMDSLPGRARYHTFFYQAESLAGYYNDIYLYSESGDSVLIESLVQRVAMDLYPSSNPKRLGSIVPYGSMEEMQKIRYKFIPDSIKSTGIFQLPEGGKDSIDIANKIVIVGDIVDDLVNVGSRKIPGPYLVTWTLSDILSGNDRLKLPIENLAIIIGQLLFFALFTVLIFALLFKYIKKLQTKPAIIALLSLLTGLFFLFLYGVLLLSMNNVIPVGQTIVSMIVATILSWRFAHKFLVTGIAEGSQKYDVFISYSWGQSDWVIKNVYEPLEALRKPNGEKLNIFFDKKNIGVGEAFTTKYMWAIVDSKCFIPVISEEYYKKNHCKNEMDLAWKRYVEKLLSVQMIAFSFDAVPEAFRHVIAIDVSVEPNFIDRIKEQLLK